MGFMRSCHTCCFYCYLFTCGLGRGGYLLTLPPSPVTHNLAQVTKVNNFFYAHQLYAHTDRHWLMMEMKTMTGLKGRSGLSFDLSIFFKEQSYTFCRLSISLFNPHGNTFVIFFKSSKHPVILIVTAHWTIPLLMEILHLFLSLCNKYSRTYLSINTTSILWKRFSAMESLSWSDARLQF